MGLDVCHWLTEWPCGDSTDVILADEDTNPILTDDANSAIQGIIVAIQVAPPGS